MRTAFVTGSSAGIGKAIATRLLDDGWCVEGFDIAAPAIAHDRFRAHALDLGDDGALAKSIRAALGKEKELIKQIELYPTVIQDAAKNHSPALVANYTYELVKEYNSFYQTVSILGEENFDKKVFRVQLSKKVSDTIKSAFLLLGIEVPERM